MQISLKRCGLSALALWLSLLMAGCAFHSSPQTTAESILWKKAFFPIAYKYEKWTFKRALATGPYSFEVFKQLFWERRDPNNNTNINEYQERLESRLEQGRAEYTTAGNSIPDDRIIPFVYYGYPSREVLIREKKRFNRVDWIYEPSAEVLQAGLKHPLLQHLAFTVTFRVDEGGVYSLCPRRRQPWSPRTPRKRHYNYSDSRTLVLLIQDANTDPDLRAAAIWRLGTDDRYFSMNALFTAAVGADPVVFAEIGKAIYPLTLMVVEDAPLATGSIPGSAADAPPTIDIEPLIPDEELMPDPTGGEPSLSVLIELMSRIYDPAKHFPAGMADSLRLEAAAADSALRSHGWLEPEEAEALYTGPLALARTLLDSNTPYAAHEYLEQYLRDELRNDAEAWHLNALAMVESPSAGGRQQSEESIRRALRLDPGNLRYLLTLARILYRRTYAYYAEDMLNHILKGAPTLAQAYAVKAIIRLEYYWQLGWRSSPWSTAPGGGPPVMGGYDQKLHYSVYRAAATDQINMALILNPDDMFATWWLGSHYLLARQWTAAIPVMNFLIENGAHAAEAYMGRGLCLQHLGLLAEAMTDYKEGLSLLPSNVRLLADDPRWVTAPSEGGFAFREEISPVAGNVTTTGGDSAAVPTRDAFWRSRDPLFTTGINERMVEQHRRFAYVTWFFAVPNLGLRGWETNRGRIYLRYGEPLEYQAIERSLGWARQEPDELTIIEDRDVDWENAADFTRNLGLAHRWTYPGVRFNFTSGWITGNYTVGDIAVAVAGLESKPESIRVEGGRPVTNMNTTWFAFRDEDGNLEWVPVVTVPALSYEIAKPNWTTTWEHPMACLVLDRQWNILLEEQFSFPVAEYLVKQGGIWIGPELAISDDTLTEQARHLALELTFQEREPAYSSRDELPVLDTEGLHLSSLIMAREIVEGDQVRSSRDSKYIIRGDIAIDPIVDEIHSPYDPLHLYLEIYDLERDEFGATDYYLALSLTALEEERPAPNPFVEALGRLIGRESREGTVTVMYERTGISTMVPEYLTVEFPQETRTGVYRIDLKITDNNAGLIAARSARIILSR